MDRLGGSTATQELNNSTIKEIGEVSISDTQKLRVLLVIDRDLEVVVSAQKWWRSNTKSPWQVGKGFKLSSIESLQLGALMSQGGTELQKLLKIK